MEKIFYIGMCLILASCASTGVIQMAKNHYMISDSNSLYSNGGRVFQDILKEADVYCAKQDKTVKVINYKIENGTSFSDASAQLEFTCE